MSAAEPRLKVMHLCAPGPVGGLERVVELLAKGMRAKGVEVHVVAVLGPQAPFPFWLQGLGMADIPIYHVAVGNKQIWGESREVDRLLSEIHPDVVHTHGYRSDLLHGHRARRRGAISATTLHGSSRMGGASQLFEWLQGWALRRFDVVVAVSEPLRQELRNRGVADHRIALIPNGWCAPEGLLDPSAARVALGIEGTEPLVGWVGRLIGIKGCDVFLNALALVRDRPWTAVVLGEGPEAPALHERAASLDLAERVRFLGSVSEAARLHPGFDVFVLSSRSEGTPMVLLEAMGAGVPVVATNVGGVAEALGSEAGSWLVPPEDPGALAAALRRVLEALGAGNPVLEAAIKAGRDRAERRFGVEPWVQAHLRAYEGAGAGPKHASGRRVPRA